MAARPKKWYMNTYSKAILDQEKFHVKSGYKKNYDSDSRPQTPDVRPKKARDYVERKNKSRIEMEIRSPSEPKEVNLSLLRVRCPGLRQAGKV